MKLQLLMNVHADLSASIEIGACPQGRRSIFNVTGGTFEGARLRGTIAASGGDWLSIDADDVERLDVRITLETNDGARIYVQYPGVLVLNEKIKTALTEGGSSEYGDTYFMTQPRFETGDARYKWLNRLVAVAEGRVRPNVVEYRAFEVVTDQAAAK